MNIIQALSENYHLLFLNALIIGGIGAFLALLVMVIDGFVNNYGEVSLNLNDKKDMKVQGGNSLLQTLAENRIFIPSACGGRGTCGACKVRVKNDIGPVFPTELPLLSKEELAGKTRLSCQIKVKKAIRLSIPDELFNVKAFKTRVHSIVDVTHDIKQIRFKLEEPAGIDFKAGQYVQLEVPPYDKIKEPTQRAYSISSTPGEPDSIELLIRLVPGGIATSYVFSSLAEQQEMKIVGPFGDFVIRDTGADMICVAGGSGMAPIKSIIYYMLENRLTERNLWYFFGARSVKDLFYLEELREIEKKWPSFHYIPSLSAPLPEDNWEGESGLITDVLDKYLKEIIPGENPKEGYLCGSPGMINACCNVLEANNISRDKIFYDKFA